MTVSSTGVEPVDTAIVAITRELDLKQLEDKMEEKKKKIEDKYEEYFGA